MLVIPAIDILGGKCVRLFNGDYNQIKKYSDDPIEVAKKFESDGAKFLHIVDLDGAKNGEAVNSNIILEIAKSVNIPVQIGGGIRDIETAKKYLENGINRIIIGTSAVVNSEFLDALIERFGSDRIIVSVDIKDGKIAMNGWTCSSDLLLENFLNKIKTIGVERIIVTDVSKDGALEGPNYQLVESIKGFKIIAAGGVSSNNDIKKFKNVEGVIVGKAIYEGGVQLVKNGLAKRIIPCMDIANGRVVKGTNFINIKDVGDAVELGKYYSDCGADELVFLDIMATVENRKTLVDLVEKVASNIFIPFTVGGGIKTLDDIRILLNAGADKIAIGSAAIADPEFVTAAANQFGTQCIVISMDCKKIDNDWELFINGGRKYTGVSALAFAREMERVSAGELLVNSLDRDGTEQGFDLELLKAISEEVNIPVIASSGAGKMDDFLDALQIVDACLAASLFHYEKLKIPDLKSYLTNNFLTIRK